MGLNPLLALATPPPSEGVGGRILNTAETAFKRLHEKGSYNPKDLQTEKAYKDLIDQTFDVFNFAITDNDMPEIMRTALQSDAFLFGGLKTHAQLFEASKLLNDEKGNLKPFAQLSNEFTKLNSTYNKNYLEAEYEFAVGSSQMAAKWSEFSDNDRYELQYRTAGDNRVRDEHANLNNITLPKSDPFWSSYTPPNGWNCRCTTVEVLKDKYEGDGYLKDSEKAIAKGEAATTQLGKNGKNRLEIFRFNPGADKRLFPPKHPYGKVAGAKVATPIILTIINGNTGKEALKEVFNEVRKKHLGVLETKRFGNVLVSKNGLQKTQSINQGDYNRQIETLNEVKNLKKLLDNYKGKIKLEKPNDPNKEINKPNVLGYIKVKVNKNKYQICLEKDVSIKEDYKFYYIKKIDAN